MRMNPQDRGMSIPLALGAMMAFSSLTILLFGIAQLSIKNNDISQERIRAFSAAEAGANDFINRLNAFPDLVQWNVAKVQPLRETAPDKLPPTIRDAAFGQ